MSDGLSGAADAICGSEASYGIWAASIASRSSWERRAKACGRSLDSEPSGERVRACLGGVDVGAAICGTACFCFDLWLTCGVFWLILVESTLAVLSRPRDIGQRAPVASHTRGRDEMRRGHLSATTLYGRDPFAIASHRRLNSLKRCGQTEPTPPRFSRSTTLDVGTRNVSTRSS